MVYVAVVVPSCAVTITVTGVDDPGIPSAIAPDAEPLATAVPLTMTVALASADDGVRVPAEIVRFDSDALLLAAPARLTAMLYVCMVVPSCAVTTTLMLLTPTASAIELDADPLATVAPSTVTVGFGC